MTVPVGREAVLTCLVEQLGAYKVAWLRVDTQTILTIHGHVITKNHRIGVTHSDHRTWCLHIKEIRQSDRGWYMCQINTDPMKSQVGFLDVVVPPDIMDTGTSTDMVVREGANVTFKCLASGSPSPNITWRREGGESIPLPNGEETSSIDGTSFNLTRVNRLHMGAYLCIASNGWPPSVSKRITLVIHFPPMIWIQNQLVGAMEGDQMTLECLSEAFPRPISYWTRESGDIISQGSKYEPTVIENNYKVHMKLTIHNVGPSDFGSYKCVSKNSLGETDGTIKLYQIPTPTTTMATTVTTEVVLPSTKAPQVKQEKKKQKERKKNITRSERDSADSPGRKRRSDNSTRACKNRRKQIRVKNGQIVTLSYGSRVLKSVSPLLHPVVAFAHGPLSNGDKLQFATPPLDRTVFYLKVVRSEVAKGVTLLFLTTFRLVTTQVFTIDPLRPQRAFLSL